MVKREYPETQPKYSLATTIPDAELGRMRSPYPKGDNWYYKNEATELRLVPYETYRSNEVTYVNGTEVIFTHGWANLDPITDWYLVQPWAVCIQGQAGWQAGERVLLNGRRCTVSVTATEILVQIGANGINIGRKNGTLNEFNLNPARWLIYVRGIRKLF